jgi:hypothetical protein
VNAKPSDITDEDRRAMVEGMLSLHAELQSEINKVPIDPSRLMRLIGAAMGQTLVAQAAMLSNGSLPPSDDPRQMDLFEPSD